MMTYAEYCGAVLAGHKTVDGFVDTLDREERDEDGLLQDIDIEERLLELLADAFAAADKESRMHLLVHGAHSFRKLRLAIQRKLCDLPSRSLSDREIHQRETGGRRRVA